MENPLFLTFGLFRITKKKKTKEFIVELGVFSLSVVKRHDFTSFFEGSLALTTNLVDNVNSWCRTECRVDELKQTTSDMVKRG